MKIKNIDASQYTEDYLNTNETIADYSFFYQIICEEKMMDFEALK